MNEQIRTRIAPSPTGLFHIGTARTALFNWLFTRRFGGKFVLRVEDTDKVRSKEEFELDIIDGLSWLGLDWDEGPETPDLYGPYRQSQRSQIYKKYADTLLEEGKAYKCYCTPEELEAEKKAQEAAHMAPKYSGKCSKLTPADQEKLEKEGKKFAVRFKIDTTLNEGEPIVFKDLIKGEVSFDSKLFGDFVILKSDGEPTFMFAGIIDDAEMKISHVIRGEDHLSNTPRQILLAQAMNLPIPEYAHLPMILNPDRTKMSKRKNPVSVSKDYQDQGYLPEAMVNFMALLGWSPPALRQSEKDASVSEIFTLKDMINDFALSDVGKSPAIFDSAKLDYFNAYYIRQLPLGDLAKRCLPYLVKAGLVEKENEMVLSVVGLVQERMKKLSDVAELTEFFFRRPKYDKALLIPKKGDEPSTLRALQESHKYLSEENDFGHDSLESLLRALAKKLGVDAGQVLWPIRVALSGRPASPGAFELLSTLGKDESLSRIKTATDMLK